MRLTRPIGSLGLALALLISTPLYATTFGSFSRPSISAPHIAPPHIEAPHVAPPTFTKPSLPPPTATITKPPLSQGGVSKPTITSAAPPAPRSAADTAIAKGQSQQAYQRFQADQQKFRAPPAAAPPDTKAAQQTPAWRQYGSRWHSADSYYAAREDALRRAPSVRLYYEHPPVYVLQGRPSYGAYAGAFLGGVLLDRIMQPSYAQWAYSHANDPGFQAWRDDMQRQAADNADLRAKLAQMDAQVAQLKAQNAPTSEALPEDVDPSLVVAPQTVMMATASTTHWWLWITAALAALGAFFIACVVISQRKSR